MKRGKIGAAWIVGAALVLAGLVSAAAAVAQGNGRQFSGFYSVSDASVSDETAHVTLMVQLFNNGSADISNGTLTMRDWTVPGHNHISLSKVSVRAGQSAQLGGTFEIPKHEYERWQQGAHPILMLEFVDAAGNKRRALVELVRRRVLPGNR